MRKALTAYYGFVDASSGGFGATVELKDGMHGRFGIWGRDAEGASSNYRELRNMVETVEEEAKQGHLKIQSCGYLRIIQRQKNISLREAPLLIYFMS